MDHSTVQAVPKVAPGQFAPYSKRCQALDHRKPAPEKEIHVAYELSPISYTGITNQKQKAPDKYPGLSPLF
jgi:hypothetical protein